MSPRKSVVETRHTRRRILDRGLEIASVEGLEGLTIGRLAAETGMSKAGVLGHFGTKESLQLAVIETAAEAFAREVPQRARDARPGLPRLRAVCEAWVSYLERSPLPGGCFFTAVAAEFDGRSGPVRDAIAAMNTLWQRELRIHVRRAVSVGDLPEDTDVDQFVYDLVATMLALNHFLQFQRDQRASTYARRALHRLLGKPGHV
ncbi:transcriptional regulator, TetR family [Streptoalloteichus tenebrarius]|uniref:Transcriptional regulator, TetR family n=1 Tax=Streptoalloteichus tenebrarius (strain ATCC 17920 / DSM 40477 / JCM 4838 / CBS 697.72 / NBRC 16177 / NCIMB 11028 / NRRL B-12390 / A12253. 1 / ISP 5477) TaxID=1933 RepID=A0ABT1I330_STRSD|nr:TetR/AcrR family transcriptional regulator [Streptoalloteichus tenebrarius]MCP2262191.1 transcriptional regulator, TetR family [Streptoalloteichus tenebrarius]BFE98971.1 TetR/AcrR family transcriptional regulator [Streptoalloteichus tenebrarius]